MDSNHVNSNSNSESTPGTNNDSVGETCIICDQKKENGIHIYTQFICDECEKEIVSTETSDVRYKYYLTQLKKVIEPMLHIK